MCGCNKSKVAVTSVQLAQQEADARAAQDMPLTQVMRERRDAAQASVVAAIANSRS